jgi:hypothetical protein
MIRKLTLYIAASLDGYLADYKRYVDFLSKATPNQE